MNLLLSCYLVGFLLVILLSCSGSSNLPSEGEFKEWLKIVYERETALQADEINICAWERPPQEVLKKAPEVDGLKVQAMILTYPALVTPGENELDQTTIHYVYCNYYRISDEWYLHASSWGGGFWKQEPAEWSHLVQDCRDKAERFRSSGGKEFSSKKQ